jgi:adenine phosphoribosyltransferase
VRIEYDLEYGSDALEMHADALDASSRVILIDDLLATGGTAQAAAELVRRLGAALVGAGFVIELVGLEGRRRLEGVDIGTLLRV